MDALFMTVTNVNFDEKDNAAMRDRILHAAVAAGGGNTYRPEDLFHGDKDVVSLRSTLLFGLRGMAAYAHHARVLGKTDPKVSAWFQKGMKALGEDHTVAEWLGLIMEFGQINLACMALLDAANTEAYGHPEPTRVSTAQEKGPFIIVTGHDLHDLKMLLEQTEGKGVNIYTHGEMLPGLGLSRPQEIQAPQGPLRHRLAEPAEGIREPPRRRAVHHELHHAAAPDLHPASRHHGRSRLARRPAHRRRCAGPQGLLRHHPAGHRPRRLEGDHARPATNLMTGFAHNAVMSVADKLVAAVKAGAVKHIYLVGGCDGAKLGRDYYTEFVEKTPKDTLVLTLACGKFRFNHLQDQLGDIGGIPRLLDMGQCNDAYSAIQVAVTLAKVFNCGVNDLPLSLILSWYEQKAVCILLTLLSLGIKNIRIGPTLPAFVSPTVLKVLVEQFGLTPITTADEDLKAIAG